MNNKNWIAVFLGLASLVLLVSVMGASNNWMNNGTNNSGTVPQQINQTVRGMDSTNKDNLPTKIDGNEMLDNMTNGMTNDMNTTSPTPSPSPTAPLIMQ